MTKSSNFPTGIRQSEIVVDPGDAGALPVDQSATVQLVSAGAETRTVAAPAFLDQRLKLYFLTDGGDIVVTSSAAFNTAGNNTITFADAGDTVILDAVATNAAGTTFAWRVLLNDGAALSTV